MTITNKNINIEVEEVSSSEYILKANSQLKPVSNSLNTKLLELRNKHTTKDANGKDITTVDLTFKSSSALASFVYGCSKNGNVLFGTYKSPAKTSPSPSSSTITSNSAEDTGTNADQETQPQSVSDKDKMSLVSDFLTYFKDFVFDPSPRGLNNMRFVKDIDEYLLSFMEIINTPEELLERAKHSFRSAEWKSLKKRLSALPKTETRINQRLIIKYGKAGTGKTTDAIRQYPNAVKIVGSASADPDDLFTRFDPSSKTYVLTELSEAMVNGKPIIIDEANLYNSVVLARLQGVLDNTTSIVDRGIEIEIKDGFKVIITMNLETNLGKTPLPDPLVSRATEIENYNKQQDLSWVW